MDTYLVGGAVRDELLDREVTERDWVVGGTTPQAMREKGFRPVGKDFPVFIHPESGEEYALARTERKSGRGYHGFEFHAAPEITLEQDLERRDLTINAMARDADGRLVDPFGGRRDLEQRLLRHVSPAFVEDPVRVWQETKRALGEPSPRSFIEVLRECGALAVVFPEVDALFGVPQRREWHPEVDAGEHLLLVMDQAARLSDEPRVRFAALVHDLGKGITPADALVMESLPEVLL